MSETDLIPELTRAQPRPLPERRVNIPVYLLPRDLRELHERISDTRTMLRELERDFNGMLREYLNGGHENKER